MTIIINSPWEVIFYAAVASLAWHAGEMFYDYLKEKIQNKRLTSRGYVRRVK